MRYRTGRRSGGRAFDKPRWVAARMRFELDRDLTMHAVPAPAPARGTAARGTAPRGTAAERPARRPD
jgi:hypothetical protein